MLFSTVNHFNSVDKKIVWWIVISVSILITACTSVTANITPTVEPKIYFPQQDPVDGERETMTGETFGKLVVVNDCIRVMHDKSDTSWLLIWPPNFSLNFKDDTIQILNKDGQAVARVGDMVRIGGGEVSSSSFFSETMKKKLPINCLAPYWIVGGEVNVLEELE